MFADGRAHDGRLLFLAGKREAAAARRRRGARAARHYRSDHLPAVLEIAEHGRGPGLLMVGAMIRALVDYFRHAVPGGVVVGPGRTPGRVPAASGGMRVRA